MFSIPHCGTSQMNVQNWAHSLNHGKRLLFSRRYGFTRYFNPSSIRYLRMLPSIIRQILRGLASLSSSGSALSGNP
jgi:hypothetical protein